MKTCLLSGTQSQAGLSEAGVTAVAGGSGGCRGGVLGVPLVLGVPSAPGVPCRGRLVKPLSTRVREADCAHQITTGTTGFSDLPMSLYKVTLSQISNMYLFSFWPLVRAVRDNFFDFFDFAFLL